MKDFEITIKGFWARLILALVLSLGFLELLRVALFLIEYIYKIIST